MNSINRRDFLNKVFCAGMIMPFISPTGWFEKTSFGSTVHIFSKHLQFLDYENMAAVASEIGFDGVDLSVRPGGHILPENVAEDLPKAVSAIKKLGLQAIMMSTNIKDATNHVNQNILRTASSLGIKYFRTDWFRYPKDGSMPDILKEYEKQMISLAAFAESLGIQGAYQNHSGNYVGASLWEVYELIKSANRNGMGSQFDIMHATIEGGLSWHQSLRLVYPNINTIVVKDFRWEKVNGKWSVINVPLGEGMVDFPKYFSLLKQYGLNVPISLHCEYKLGGAEHGAKQISLDQKVVFEAMHKDLVLLRKWLKDAALN